MVLLMISCEPCVLNGSNCDIYSTFASYFFCMLSLPLYYEDELKKGMEEILPCL